MTYPCDRDDQALKRLARFLRGNLDVGVIYTKDRPTRPSHTEHEAWLDSDWASCPDTRRSRTGIAFSFAGDLVRWAQFEKVTASLASAESEYAAASQAGRDAKWIRNLTSKWKMSLLAPDIYP
jgi:hypothetical protein